MQPSRENVDLRSIVGHCESLLHPTGIEDYKGAVNGLQVENSGKVTHIGAAVDASLHVIQRAIDLHVDLLIVHHGLFWTPRIPWTGPTFQIARLLIQNDLALYSSHLPLDVHPELGNNACLVHALNLRNPIPCPPIKGVPLGLRCHDFLPRHELESRLAKAVDSPVHALRFGPELCQYIAIVSGGAGSEIASLAAEGVDTIITGEGPHWTFALAQELQVNVLYGGHYATETFGVKALAHQLSQHFHLPWTFIHQPSGL